MRAAHALAAAVALCCACAKAPGGRDALRRIVQEQCVPRAASGAAPAPCERLELPAGPRGHEGYALLHDRKGGAHFLLIPVVTVEGTESEGLRRDDAPNYFAAAWQAGDLLAAYVGHAVGRDAIGLAVNPRHARSQDQFHIHIECVRPDVHAALASSTGRLGASWTPLDLGGRRYLAKRVMGETLGGASPIASLARERPETVRGMGDYTFIVAGMSFADGPGFVWLASDRAAGELLLDSTCALAALQ